MRSKATVPWERLSEFVLRCGEVRDPYQFCVTALEGLHGLIDFDEGVFFMLDGNRKITRKYFSNISRHWSSLYLEYFSRSSPEDFELDQDISEQRGVPFVKVIDWDEYRWLNDDFMVSYIRARAWETADGADELTVREREVCELLCKGVKPHNIARELHISLGTANKHIAHIYRKFGVNSRQELLVRLLGE